MCSAEVTKVNGSVHTVEHRPQQFAISVSPQYLSQVWHFHTSEHFSTSICCSDDDVYLNSSAANLGEIKIEIWTIVNVSKTPDFIDPTGTSNAKVHERSKKIGAHRVQYVFS